MAVGATQSRAVGTLPVLYERQVNLMTIALRKSKLSDHAAVVMIATAAWF